jgi:DNA polymerase-1
LYRAFYGVPDLSNSQGLHTNAIYGFLNIMFSILEEEKPEYLVVAFDDHAPTFRHAVYAEYKGTRKPTPPELREQVPVMRDVLAAMGVSVVVVPGLEADDILGTLAVQAEKDGMAVSLVTGDRDLLQIASDNIKIRIPKTKFGRTEIHDYHSAEVLRDYQVTPQQFIDVKALMGDASDNIPGVPKVGEKTATELIVKYGSLAGVYEHLEEITKASIKESLLSNRDLADLSRELATIKTDSELGFTYQAGAVGDFYTKEAYNLFKELEFKHFLNRFDSSRFADADAEAVARKRCFQEITDIGEAEGLFEGLIAGSEAVGAALVADESDGENLLGAALAVSDEAAYYLPVGARISKDYLVDRLQALTCEMVIFDAKKAYGCLLSVERVATEGLAVALRFFDVLLAAYLLNPLKNEYEISDISELYLGMECQSYAQLFGKMPLAMAALQTEFYQYACMQAYVCRLAAPLLAERLQEAGMAGLFRDIEMPLSYVLYDMERIGVMVRPDELKDYGEALVGRIGELEGLIYEKAGMPFNINSPKQLGEILFERLQLPGGKKTKTGYSTAADVLERLHEEHPIIADILAYRTYTKLKSTYVEGLSAFIGADSRIHTSFKQTVTATGRLSSADPNLQNIPTRTELGRRIRKVFVPSAGYIFMDADYSQIELRILAHLSADERLIEAYHQDADIHRATAAQVFHTPPEAVTDAQRRNAKAVNFGIVYGISSFGLSQDLTISRKEAEGYIEQYFATYPKVKGFLDETVAAAKGNGYVTTIFGRRRPVPELASSNFMQRSFGERVAMNSPIQGAAADIIKIAMIRVWERLRREGLRSRLVLQIHDELLLEVAEGEEEQARQILSEEMPGAAELAVELAVNLSTGFNWYEAK